MASENSNPKVNLLGKSPEELREILGSLGEPGYRGAQIYHAMYVERKFEFKAMTNLPSALREKLARQAVLALPRVVRRHFSCDGTVRSVLRLGALDVSRAAGPCRQQASKRYSCRRRIGRRSAFRRKRAAQSIANFATRPRLVSFAI